MSARNVKACQKCGQKWMTDTLMLKLKAAIVSVQEAIVNKLFVLSIAEVEKSERGNQRHFVNL